MNKIETLRILESAENGNPFDCQKAVRGIENHMHPGWENWRDILFDRCGTTRKALKDKYAEIVAKGSSYIHQKWKRPDPSCLYKAAINLLSDDTVEKNRMQHAFQAIGIQRPYVTFAYNLLIQSAHSPYGPADWRIYMALQKAKEPRLIEEMERKNLPSDENTALLYKLVASTGCHSSACHDIAEALFSLYETQHTEYYIQRMVDAKLLPKDTYNTVNRKQYITESLKNNGLFDYYITHSLREADKCNSPILLFLKENNENMTHYKKMGHIKPPEMLLNAQCLWVNELKQK